MRRNTLPKLAAVALVALALALLPSSNPRHVSAQQGDQGFTDATVCVTPCQVSGQHVVASPITFPPNGNYSLAVTVQGVQPGDPCTVGVTSWDKPVMISALSDMPDRVIVTWKTVYPTTVGYTLYPGTVKVLCSQLRP